MYKGYHTIDYQNKHCLTDFKAEKLLKNHGHCGKTFEIVTDTMRTPGRTGVDDI